MKGYLHLIKDRTDSRLKRENAINTRMAYFSSTLTLLIANRFSSDTTSSREIPSRVSSVGPIPNIIVLQSLTKVNRASEWERVYRRQRNSHYFSVKCGRHLFWNREHFDLILTSQLCINQSYASNPCYRCCLWFSSLTPNWLFHRYTITFHKYFWSSR